MRSQGSILDSLRAEVSRVNAELGGGDKVKLGEYLDSVREVEQRIQNSESQPLDIELPERPLGIPERFDEHTKLMFDLHGAGVPRRRDARVQHDHVARAQHPHVRAHRRAGAAPRRRRTTATIPI